MTFRKRAAGISAVLTVSLCLAVLAWIIPPPVGGVAFVVVAFGAGIGTPLAVAGYVGYLSRQVSGVVLSVGGSVLLLVGMGLPLQIVRPCLGCVCRHPENYVYWQHIRAEIAFTNPYGLGPALRVTAEPNCLCGCPWYYVPLVPLFVGYGLLLLALAVGARGESVRERFRGPRTTR